MTTRLTQRAREPTHIRHDLARHRQFAGKAWGDKAVLQVDDVKRGADKIASLAWG
ncbi:hypothetical protein OYT13_07500 [Pandoraea sp. XJJ-1]|uniref:hypothetical protein n=1 Tax=Pandoraea sp. XJJ-1 TaxID=3002643 RepID=UPI00227F6376|nr:hypothetical protein [Pandoraea sp. XJJ-1]WAL84272.1 hypothetical protein OYT13_07500 [Pandoraea sp. XJJ-1]